MCAGEFFERKGERGRVRETYEEKGKQGWRERKREENVVVSQMATLHIFSSHHEKTNLIKQANKNPTNKSRSSQREAHARFQLFY